MESSYRVVLKNIYKLKCSSTESENFFRNLKTQNITLVMATLVKFLFAPLVPNARKKRPNRSSLLDAPPLPVDDTKMWEFGNYSWKATVEAGDRTFIGYSENMNITMKTQVACNRYKVPGTECSEAVLSIRGGQCEEVIMLKTNEGVINLSSVN
jgi:hypothetical protein